METAVRVTVRVTAGTTIHDALIGEYGDDNVITNHYPDANLVPVYRLIGIKGLFVLHVDQRAKILAPSGQRFNRGICHVIGSSDGDEVGEYTIQVEAAK